MGRKKISELQIAAILLPNATPAAIQNANLPICQLPAEILSYIFLFYKHSTMEDEIDKTKGLTQSNLNHDAVPYIAPSHVCSYWRHVVLSTPSFWSTLLLNHIGWGEELIRRSGRAPLDVHRHQLVKNGHNKTIFTRCLSQALQESHRIRSVDLTNAFQFQDFVLWKSVPQYFTKALEEIQISKLKSLILTELPSNVDWFTSFLSVTLAQSQGTIRELDLVMTVTSPIPTFASDSLATLRLRSIPPSELHAFVQQLGKLPRLESLVLVGSWSRLPPVFDPALMVQLPYLRELELTFDPETCDFILCHISGHQLRVLRILAAEKTPILVGGEYPLKLCRSIASLTVMSGDTVYPCVNLGIGDVSSVFSFVPEKSFK
ncbi:hypothetical protein DL96DRAFT_1099903 [Flagelloscypha sp. PMI_526]|nr:hypothetical protein DL96DRAFT_1099903 [Flagelloscypha sp. PMI_526]